MDEEEIKEVYAVHEVINRHIKAMVKEASGLTDEPGIFVMSLLRTAVDLTSDLLANSESDNKDFTIQKELLIHSIAQEIRGVKHDRTEH